MFGFFKKDKKPQEKPKGPPQVGKTDLCLDDTRSLARCGFAAGSLRGARGFSPQVLRATSWVPDARAVLRRVAPCTRSFLLPWITSHSDNSCRSYFLAIYRHRSGRSKLPPRKKSRPAAGSSISPPPMMRPRVVRLAWMRRLVAVWVVV